MAMAPLQESKRRRDLPSSKLTSMYSSPLTHYIIPEGPYAKACAKLGAKGFQGAASQADIGKTAR